jgi:hypothetical protein
MDERPTLQALIERHCATLRVNTDLIGQYISDMATSGPAGEEARSQALDLTHQVAGAGGSIGFRPVSVAAKALEHALKDAGSLSEARRDEVLRRFAALREIVAAIRPEASSLHGLSFGSLGGSRQRQS